jgi:nucleoside-diphosphate-sugar epimerase
MSTLVTGAGMVAAQVAGKLVERGESTVLYDLNPHTDFLSTVLDLEQVEIVVGDILDMSRLVETIKSKNIKRIIHTAGWLTEPSVMTARPYYMLKVNLLGTATILEAARILGLERVIFSSSGAVYMNASSQPEDGTYDEDFPMQSLSFVAQAPGGLYALTKSASEHLGLIYSKSYGVEFAVVRYSAVFGPLRGKAAGTAGRLIDRLVRGGVFNKPVIIDSLVASGGELVYSKDAAEANILACFTENLSKKVYNISMAKPYDFLEIIDTAKDVFPYIEIDARDIPTTLPQFPAKGCSFDISSAQQELGFKPYDLKEAMKDFAKWVTLNESPDS